MTVTLPASIPTPIIGGRWLDSGSTGQSLVVLSPSVNLATGAEWYLQGGTAAGALADMVSSDWTGPVTATDGSGNPVQVFTVKSINGTGVDRYTQYFYAVGQRDPANPSGSFVHSPASSGAYPTNGWNSGTTITPTVSKSTSGLTSANYLLSWNAVSGVDFGNKYLVQRGVGTVDPRTGGAATTAGTSAYHAAGTTESDALNKNGIAGFYTYTETSDTSIPVTIADANGSHWTWYRVMAYSPLWGYTGVVKPGGTVTSWVGVPNDVSKFPLSGNTPTSTIVVGEPTAAAPSGTGGSTVVDGVTASNLPLETNLPMMKTGIGGISHPAGANRTALHPGTPRWRDGMLVLNADQSVSQSVYSRRWGFRFHYNPSTWSQSVQMAEGIDLTKYAQTGGNLLLPSTFASVGLTIYLNRIIELSTDIAPDDPFGISQRARALAAGDFYLGSGDQVPLASINPVGLSGSYFDWNGSTPLPLTSGYSTVEDKVAQVLRKGTLADLEYLYRAANGDPREVTFSDEKTADVGMLGMTPMDLYLGPGIKYTVRVSSMSVQHAMFSSRMIPMFTEVSLNMVRGISLKDATVDTVGLIANTSSWTGSGS